MAAAAAAACWSLRGDGNVGNFLLCAIHVMWVTCMLYVYGLSLSVYVMVCCCCVENPVCIITAVILVYIQNGHIYLANEKSFGNQISIITAVMSTS